MNNRREKSRDSLFRHFSVSLAVVTSLMLVPASWVVIERVRPEPPEAKPRPIEIVRLPPETLPPPPPLPPKPKVEKRERPKPIERPPEPEPEPEKLEPVFEPVIPEIEVPEEKRVQKRETIRAQEVLDVRFAQKQPDVDLPKEKRPVERESLKVATRETPRVEKQLQPVTVTVPKAVPRTDATREVEVASLTKQSYHDTKAPDVEVATPRPATRASASPSRLPPSQKLRTGVAVARNADAPAVDVPRGNTAKAGHSAPVAISGAFTGSNVTYDKDPGGATEVAIPTPKATSAGGAAPAVAVADGGAPGLKYSAAPSDTPVGPSGQSRSSAGPEKLERVRSALARRYGLPLVSVNDLGQRSTEAARWNVLLPQISELLKRSRDLGDWTGSREEEVLGVERDGDGLVIRYRDGVVHVLVPADNGLVMLFVARGQGARPITSKVEEAESAKRALHRYTRGAS